MCACVCSQEQPTQHVDDVNANREVMLMQPLRTVATSILAELSFGISQIKFKRPSSAHKGMSCQADTFLPPVQHLSVDCTPALSDNVQMSRFDVLTFILNEDAVVSSAAVTLHAT